MPFFRNKKDGQELEDTFEDEIEEEEVERFTIVYGYVWSASRKGDER